MIEETMSEEKETELRERIKMLEAMIESAIAQLDWVRDREDKKFVQTQLQQALACYRAR